MIKYEQIDGDSPLKDVRVITDNADGEMTKLIEAFENTDATDDFDAYQNLEDCIKDGSGNFTFVIPADEVGEVSEFIWEVDNGALGNAVDQWNNEAIEAAEKNGA